MVKRVLGKVKDKQQEALFELRVNDITINMSGLQATEYCKERGWESHSHLYIKAHGRALFTEKEVRRNAVLTYLFEKNGSVTFLSYDATFYLPENGLSPFSESIKNLDREVDSKVLKKAILEQINSASVELIKNEEGEFVKSNYEGYHLLCNLLSNKFYSRFKTVNISEIKENNQTYRSNGNWAVLLPKYSKMIKFSNHKNEILCPQARGMLTNVINVIRRANCNDQRAIDTKTY